MRTKLHYSPLLSSFLLCLLLFAITGKTLAQPNKLQLRVSCDTSVMIGDSMSLRVEYINNDIRGIRPTAIDPNISKGLEFFPTAPSVDTVFDQSTGLYTLSVAYPFSIYEVGSFMFPPLSFEVLNPDGSQEKLFSDSIRINVYAPEVDTTKAIKDIKDIIHVSFAERLKEYYNSHKTLLWSIFAALIVLGLGIFLYFKFLRKGKETQSVSKIPKLSPKEQALSDLSRLKEKQLWQKNQVKTYYTELTDILRVFISDKYGIHAIEMTSDELMAQLREYIAQEKESLQQLNTVLQTADLVKFAKSTPLPTQHEDCYHLVWNFVENSLDLTLNTKEDE